MMDIIQAKCKEEADSRDITYTGYEVIMDDTMLFALIFGALINYTEVIIYILSHHR